MLRTKDPDVSQITDFLYISGWPRSEHVEQIRASNVRLILSMHWIKPTVALGVPPIRLLWLPSFDSPVIPIPMNLLLRGVEAALPVIQDGYGVLAHCRYGVHRSVAMACCTLIGMGYSADEAMRMVKDKRSTADPDIWYIRRRILKFMQLWNERRN